MAIETSLMSKVSVIIPVHNVEKYLRKCVESVVQQTLTDIEIILVENMSTDSSHEICMELAEQDSRIKVLKLDHSGISYVRNKGVEAATSPYIAFVDGDDIIKPEMYDEMFNLAEKDNLDLVTCQLLKRYEYRSDRLVYKSDGTSVVYPATDFLRLCFESKIPNSVCTMLCRKDLFKDIEFPEGMYFEDVATIWRLIKASHKCGHINKAFYIYLRRPGSIVHTMNFQKAENHARADRAKLSYISQHYSDDDILRLGMPSALVLFKMIIKMVKLAKTDEEKALCLEYRDFAMALPHNYPYRKRKYHIYQHMVTKHWKLLCLLKRGNIL
ncbi:MAG: glycosyltransferase [Muribaculaceae bacterium]|nr:glycosyltransferase [Muribaculaceae bacterium]